jgi:hypothetical protein
MKTHARLSRTLVALAIFLIASCSRQSPDATQSPQAAPLVAAPTSAPAAETLKGQLTTADTAVSYEASFANGHLARISETRGAGPAHQVDKGVAKGVDNGINNRGDYDFYGARLLHYKGAALSDGAPIELAFNMQGALTSTRAARAVTPEEVAALRTRAELLRNHALAQQSVRSHRTQ